MPVPSYMPVVPDALQDQEFIPIIVVKGEEWGVRDSTSVCTTYAAALELGQAFAKNVGMGAEVVVLCREVGPWKAVPDDVSHS